MLRWIIALAAVAAILAGATSSATDDLPPPTDARSHVACDAKWLLAGHNVFKIRTFTAEWTRTKQGCTWGDRAEAATRKMKYELGYPKRWLNGTFGPNLYAFLTGKQALPPLFVVRRAERHPVIQLTQSYPLKNRAAMCGWPGQGTHSFWASPNNWQSDWAVDMCVAEGTPILAVRSGTLCDKLGALYPGSQGRFGGIRFYLCADNDTKFYYQHAKAMAPGMRLGTRVKAGQTIAFVGVANVAHLHLSCAQAKCRYQSWWGDFLGIKGV